MCPIRIAIADDERDMRDYLSRSLPRLGMEIVAVAENGRQLVELCRQNHPDVVLTDIRMPEMDGIDAMCTLWKEMELPVVFVSAFHEEKRLEPRCALHICEYLEKPVKRGNLSTAIQLVHAKQCLLNTLIRLIPNELERGEAEQNLPQALARIMLAHSWDELAAWQFLGKQSHLLESIRHWASDAV